MSSQYRMLGSVSDLMAGLMMVFLFIAIAYMIEVRSNEELLKEQNDNLEDQVVQQIKATDEAEKQKLEAERQRKRAEEQEKLLAKQGETIKEIAVTYKELQTALYQALRDEFDDDLPRWNASLERDNTIRFNEPDVLFASGQAEIRTEFRVILDDFFPRYVSVLRLPKFQDEIEEVRVEGHTSKEWLGAETMEDRYLRNAELSQERAFSVLDYCFRILENGDEHGWLIHHLRANGVSFARPVVNDQGEEDRDRSRRVEFRAITKSRERIERIIEQSEEALNGNP
jgi:chemotaxis protein MotB